MVATIKKDNEKGNVKATDAIDATDAADNAAAAAAATDDVTIATTTTSCTPDEFITAFNRQRTVLAGFAHCTTIEELHIVRDGFILGLAKDLCPDQYKSVLILILRKQFASQQKQEKEQEQNGIHIPPETSSSETKTIGKGIENEHGMLSMSFEEMVLAARTCDENNNSNGNDVDDNDATSVGSDLESIWKTLEDGRLIWIRAVNAAHPMKVILKHALKENNTENNPGDVSDAMMVWIYCLCINLIVSKSETKSEPSTVVDDENENDDNNNTDSRSILLQLQNDVNLWFIAVNMKDKYNPLQGYQSELWDPRRDEWRSLDIGAQEAAERGGTTLFDAWNA
ncbi:hypothetical protein FRACYDRAFT_241114 [Fragilariopsis cylindrus CCMP1102]|uniref:Uncharacterized protein n=1 Tax=Fragilariopsis cylindrus CCMP1102 TaxID=635003 RepID=A0A1E7F8T8_9STRA|nr:hypothetical protein FRACYDRAFT_241114 [Fragilariopsis cylindrus CCMP1102]|eukprot:OEU14566.1 hypothetical protein FRACYDRAFT_241114 [Fragilariopsis cylindrus CCMP1102]